MQIQSFLLHNWISIICSVLSPFLVYVLKEHFPSNKPHCRLSACEFYGIRLIFSSPNKQQKQPIFLWHTQVWILNFKQLNTELSFAFSRAPNPITRGIKSTELWWYCSKEPKDNYWQKVILALVFPGYSGLGYKKDWDVFIIFLLPWCGTAWNSLQPHILGEDVWYLPQAANKSTGSRERLHHLLLLPFLQKGLLLMETILVRGGVTAPAPGSTSEFQ